MNPAASPHVFDASLPTFEQDVLLRSKELPVLVDFWATWCGPCKTLGPVLEKLADEFAGAFLLAKVDVDREQQLAGYFQIKSVPTVMLVRDGQIVDGFPGALPEGQLREFLAHHGVTPRAPADEVAEEAAEPAPPVDPHAEVVRLRAATQAAPEDDSLRLDLALALLRDAPPREILQAAIAADPGDLHARHLLGARELVDGDAAAGMDQFLEILRADRAWRDGLAKRALIDAFRVVEDEDLVGRYRRRMSSLLF